MKICCTASLQESIINGMISRGRGSVYCTENPSTT